MLSRAKTMLNHANIATKMANELLMTLRLWYARPDSIRYRQVTRCYLRMSHQDGRSKTAAWQVLPDKSPEELDSPGRGESATKCYKHSTSKKVWSWFCMFYFVYVIFHFPSRTCWYMLMRYDSLMFASGIQEKTWEIHHEWVHGVHRVHANVRPLPGRSMYRCDTLLHWKALNQL